MMNEHRDDNGRPTFEINCTICGVMLEADSRDSGLQLARLAVSRGWSCFDGWWACSVCKPGDWKWLTPVPDDYYPHGSKMPEVICQNCGQISLVRKDYGKKCHKCKEEIKW